MLPDLYHYSQKAFAGPVVSRAQDPGPYWFKPNGLWVSADTYKGRPQHGWPRWCLSENYGPLEARARVTLKPDANVLLVDGAVALMEFHETFSQEWRELPTLNWLKVSKRYAGIIICPYQWGLRMDMHWYYSWDCASGCIWDANAIDRIEPDLEYAGPSIFQEENT